MLHRPDQEADSTQLRDSLSAKSRTIGKWDRQVQQLTAQVQHLAEKLAQLIVQHVHVTTTSMPPIPHIPFPNKYSGDPASCRGFLLQCQLYFAAHPNMSEQGKLTRFMTLLTDDAMKWATAVCDSEESFDCYEQFMSWFLSIMHQREKRWAKICYPSAKVEGEFQSTRWISASRWQKACGIR